MTSHQESTLQTMRGLIFGFSITRSIVVAAELGIKGSAGHNLDKDLEEEHMNCHETNQRKTAMKILSIVAIAAFTFLALANFASAQDWQGHKFQVSSTTFENNSTLPIVMIHNVIVNGSNGCSINGTPGGNESPELSWTNVPRGTRSFVVVAYDVTAAFTHWGMYNISGDAAGLPEDAGVAGSIFGLQIRNDFGISSEYDGPCPPPNFPPNVHHYVFTVYALDIELHLSSSANFPANSETLYHALIKAGRHGHILASASITGLYSTTPE